MAHSGNVSSSPTLLPCRDSGEATLEIEGTKCDACLACQGLLTLTPGRS